MAAGTRLQNQIALITGAASGIGLAAAELFAAEGASLMLADIDCSRLQAAAKNLSTRGANIHFAAGDLSSSAIARRVVEEAVQRFGRIDILFNNAAIDLQATIEDTSDQDLDRITSVNFKSAFYLTKAALPHIDRVRGGSIINTSSAAALYPVAGRPAYCATTGAIVSLTKALALDLAPHIRVNCICPGAVDTPLLQQDIAAAKDPRERHASVVARYPIGRLAEPDEIARVALFLACSDSSYVTGSVISADGGRTMH
jgi:NAD(P)-dependent dehydrogenase (short-subunit alcohol dehydrogenase family)